MESIHGPGTLQNRAELDSGFRERDEEKDALQNQEKEINTR
jgi:hypothetical protein